MKSAFELWVAAIAPVLPAARLHNSKQPLPVSAGNSDDDEDVDASDLAAWEVSIDNGILPLDSVQSAASDQSSASLSQQALSSASQASNLSLK